MMGSVLVCGRQENGPSASAQKSQEDTARRQVTCKPGTGPSLDTESASTQNGEK